MISTAATMLIDRSVEDTFHYVIDPTNEPNWHTDVVEAHLLTDGPVAVGSRARWLLSFMGRREQVMEVTRLEPNRAIELQGKTILGLTPTITYELFPEGSGTQFTRRIQMETSGIGNLFVPMLRSGGVKRNEKFVLNLKRVLEGQTSA